MTKAVNYTTEQTQHMVEAYTANPTRETVDAIASELGKTVKSVIGKLSREKVYIKAEYTTKRGEKPITKLEMVGEMADMLGIKPESIAGLTKASQMDLDNLKKAIEKQ